jgi:hypothetical protein
MTGENQERRATWTHNGDECVAVEGEQLKWRSPIPKTGRSGYWQYGSTVLKIDPIGRVHLDPAGPLSGWHWEIECGPSFKLEMT